MDSLVRYNLFVSWELQTPEACASFAQRLSSLGEAVQLQAAFVFLASRMPFDEAHAHLSENLRADDKVAVVEAAGGVSMTLSTAQRNAIDKLWLEGRPSRGPKL